MMKTSFLHRLPLFPPTPTFPCQYSPPSHSQHLRLRSSPPSLVTLIPQMLRPRRVLCSSSARPCAGGDGDGDFDRFAEAAKDFNLLPMYKTMSSDEIDPDTAYKRLTRDDDPLSPSFISTLPSSKEHYTLIGAQPAVEFVAKENFVTIIDRWEGSRREEYVENPMLIPERMMKKWKPQPLAGLPDTFSGGWFGYFSYDTFRYVEKNFPFSSAPKDDQNLPDVDICLYDNVIIFDHKQKIIEESYTSY